MRTVAIIQARMTSTRLPGKVLADVCGKPLLAHMINRVRKARSIDDLVVATTTNATDDPVETTCAELGVQIFRGNEYDVLGRYRDAAQVSDAEVIVRLTADCPMIDPDVIDDAVEKFKSHNYDYVSNAIVATFPDGLDVEVFSRSALDRAVNEAQLPFHREHVTPYMRTGAYDDIPTGDFLVGHVKAPSDFSHIRITVDTADDLERIRRLIPKLPENYRWMDILALITRQPQLMDKQASASEKPELRRVTNDDAQLLLEWVNQPDNLAGKLDTNEPIAWDRHVAWLETRLADTDTAMWIAEINRKPVGQVRLQMRAQNLEVDIYVTPNARKSGIATSMIEHAAAEAAKLWPDVPLVAKIRSDNIASRRLFARANFGGTQALPNHVVMTRLQKGDFVSHG